MDSEESYGASSSDYEVLGSVYAVGERDFYGVAEDNEGEDTQNRSEGRAGRVVSRFDWQERLHEANACDTEFERFQKASQVANEFVETAQRYGSVIIAERGQAEKTIKPLSVGGVAGGDKYICAGIFFKFALDVELAGGFLYGKERNDEGAAKAVSGGCQSVCCRLKRRKKGWKRAQGSVRGGEGQPAGDCGAADDGD